MDSLFWYGAGFTVCCVLPMAVICLGIVVYFLTRKPKAVLPTVQIKKKEEKNKMDVPITPIAPVPSGTSKGWTFEVNGQSMDINHLVGFNPRVGWLIYGYNGRFDQPTIFQNPGRLVVYVCNHPDFGILMGGAEEPRLLANGSMFTPAGGFDPATDNAKLVKIREMPEGPEKVAAMEAYGKENAAREALDEMGLDVKDLIETGKSTSNRAFFVVNLAGKIWNGETVYLVIVPPELLSADLTISLPEGKMGDIMPAPEWSSIKKLQFKGWKECFASPDGVAVSAFAKAYAWAVENLH